MSANQSPILIVDDEKDNLEALHRLLRSQYAVTTTTSPIEGLKLIQTNKFHVIVSDQRMPEMTGVEFLEKVKQMSPGATRILLTGYTDIASVIDAINRGNIYRYIAKPWDPDDFKITLNQAVEAYKLRVELEEKNAQLSSALEELKTLDKAKSRFLSLVSHELNTPLTVLSSFVQLLEGEKKGLSSEVQKFVGSISEASNRFSEIVSEVMTYIKLTSNQGISLKETDIGKVVSETITKLNKELESKKIKIKNETKFGTKHGVDSLQFSLLVEKILQDSVARATQNTETVFNAEKNDGKLVLKIKSEGTPVSKESFEPMVAGGNEMHHQKNLGLALATAKLIVDSHKGKIEAKSEGKSQVLEVILP